MPKYKIHIDKLAKITGFSTTHTYNLIHGNRKISWKVAEKLSSLSGTSASWWMRATKAEVKKALTDPKTWAWSPLNIERRKSA